MFSKRTSFFESVVGSRHLCMAPTLKMDIQNKSFPGLIMNAEHMPLNGQTHEIQRQQAERHEICKVKTPYLMWKDTNFPFPKKAQRVK